MKSHLISLLAKDAGNLEIRTFDQQKAFMVGLYIGMVLPPKSTHGGQNDI